MKLYKPTYKAKSGETKKCKHWYLTFVDNRQKRIRMPLYSNKRASVKVIDRIEEILSGVSTPELQKWLEQIPNKMRENLIRFRLIDSLRVSENLGKSLSEHLKDFCESMKADNRKTTYIRQNKSIIKTILTECSFNNFSDIDGNKVKTFLAKSRGQDGYGQRTYNNYLMAFKMFCLWLVRENRVVGKNPMDGQALIKQTEFRKERRPFTLEEKSLFLETVAQSAIKHSNMNGYERSLVYRLALEVGARANEIRQLKVKSFNFFTNPATVRIEASTCKSKRTDDLLLSDETARDIQKHLKGKDLQCIAFKMPYKSDIMIKKDLKESGIEYRDDAGRDIDFHSLRHTFITHLALAGVHPTVTQKLARHENITTTMKYYTHVLHDSEVGAIEALHNLSCKKQIKKIG